MVSLFFFVISTIASAQQLPLRTALPEAHQTQTCAQFLAPRPGAVSAGALIANLLQGRGAELGATNIAIFEITKQNGETELSRVYFTRDGSDPVTPEEYERVTRRFQRRSLNANRLNLWELDLNKGGTVIRSLPLWAP